MNNLKQITLLLLTVCAGVSCVAEQAQAAESSGLSALETDDAYHIERVRRPSFEKADANKDGVLTIADRRGWNHSKQYDVNADGTVTFEEFTASRKIPAARKVLHNVVYKKATGQKCLMDIYLPEKQTSEPAPVFYVTHGGGWVAGNKDLGGHLETLVSQLLSEGIVCVSVSYRLVKVREPKDPVTMKECVEDAKDGMRFLKKHAADLGVDANRIMPFGFSAGGHLALMLTYSAPEEFIGAPELAEFLVQPVGGISWFGPSDFTVSDLFVPKVEGWKGLADRFTPRIKKGAAAVSYQKADDDLKTLMRQVSPVYYLKKSSPPVLAIHGDKDTTIPQQHSFHLKEKADAAGCSVQVIPVSNAGHGFRGDCKPSPAEILAAMKAFVVKHLGVNGE